MGPRTVAGWELESMWRCVFLLVPLAAVVSAGGCGATLVPYALAGAPEVYTLTNLHPDPRARELWSVNYQHQGLIPLCTPVKIHQVTTGEMWFTTLSDGLPYVMRFHKTLAQPISMHLDQYFGPVCDASVIQTLGEVDQIGIARGEILVGMTKAGVTLAVGYPPLHATASLDQNDWTYWRSRADRFVVHFENGRVARVVH
jgi:hypothetical protein